MANINELDRAALIDTFDGRAFGKASFCESGWCVGLPVDGVLDAVVDTKTGVVLSGLATGLVAFAKGYQGDLS